MERWNFGVEPLTQTSRAASLLRRVTDLVLALEDEDAEVEALVSELERAEERLARAGAVRSPAPGGCCRVR